MDTDPGSIHKTVLLHEVVEFIAPKPGGRYLDGTLGMGGHTQGIIEAANGEATVLGLDRDAEALELAGQRLAPFGDRVIRAHINFGAFERAMDEVGWDRLDGAVLDLGVSSLQLDRGERGFSFLHDGPLDMRMDPGSGLPPAKALVARASHGELARIIREFGDEPLAGKIASAILRARAKEEITTTAQLAHIVEMAYPPDRRRQARNHPATRTFQALRVAVNRELDELNEFLARIAHRLNPGARVAILSFHSLEDRAVKRSFASQEKGCTCPPRQPVCTCGGEQTLKVLTKKPLAASEAETESNVRSRSAKLRVAERTGKEAAGE